MLISVNCPCGKKLRVKAEAAGKRVRCPACQEPIRIPVPKSQRKELEDASDIDENSWNDSEGSDFEQSPVRPKKKKKTKKTEKPSKSASRPIYLTIGIVGVVVLGGLALFATRVMNSKRVEQVEKVEKVEMVKQADLTAFDYGPPPPEGLVLSACVIGELEALRTQEAIESGNAADLDSPQSTAKLIRTIRQSNAQAFCYSSDEEKLMAGGEGDRAAAQKEWATSKKELLNTSVESPKVYQKLHQEATDSKLSVARTRALSFFVLMHILDKLT